MEELLHQLIGGKHLIIDRVSAIRLVMQDFASIHSRCGKLMGKHYRKTGCSMWNQLKLLDMLQMMSFFSSGKSTTTGESTGEE